MVVLRTLGPTLGFYINIHKILLFISFLITNIHIKGNFNLKKNIKKFFTGNE